MPFNYFPTQVTSATGASGNLVASSAGQSIRVWQLVVASTNAAVQTVTVVSTTAGTSNTLTIAIASNSTVVLPMTGVTYAIADAGTAVTFTGAASVTLTAYYSKGAGG